MICWQTAGGARRNVANATGVWLALALAINAHTFAIFLFVPFAAAQFVRDYRKQIDWKMWAAIVLFPLGILPALKGERLAAKAYGGNFWATSHLGQLLYSYKEYLQNEWLQVFALLLSMFILAVALRKPSEEEPAPQTTGSSASEWTLVVVLSVLPLYALPASYLIHVYRRTMS